MKICDRHRIDRQVRSFVSGMPSNYADEVNKDQIISEILSANHWFWNIDKTKEEIREEVRKQFELYVS